jgi:hypothetical protein
VSDVVDAITTNMRLAGTVRGVGRQDVYEYPVEALREAIVNAIMHRDYSPSSRGAQVQVEMYPSRLVVRNPGGLFGHLRKQRYRHPCNAQATAPPGHRISEVLLTWAKRTSVIFRQPVPPSVYCQSHTLGRLKVD